MSHSKVEEKVAIVTGAAGGLGLGIAARLAEQQPVLLMDLNAQLLEDATAGLAATGARVAHAVCDVGDAASVAAAFAAAEAQLGEVTDLVNVAGVATYSPFKDLTAEMWDRTYAVNVRGAFLTSQVFLQRRAGRPGGIVNISSIGARMGLETLVDYGSSKAAIIELSHSLARIGAPTGVRVNTVMPGLIWTDMWRGGAEWLIAHGLAPADTTPEALFARTVEQAVPMKRPQTVGDIAEMVVFLLSDRAANVTGQTISVDGGVVMT